MIHEHVPTAAVAGSGRRTHTTAEPHAVASRYRHILVPTLLDPADRAALLQGLELAALHGATLGVLYLSPDDEANSFNWLDAIDRLHRPTGDGARTDAAGDALDDSALEDELACARVKEFLERELPAALLERVEIRIDLRSGDPGDAITRFADAAAADLIVLSSGPSRWWLPSLPAAVRRVLQQSQREVLIVRPDVTPTRTGAPATGVDVPR